MGLVVYSQTPQFNYIKGWIGGGGGGGGVGG